MVNRHSIDYHPNILGLTTRIHLLIFLDSSELCFPSEYLFNSLSSLLFHHGLMVFRLLENPFVTQKIESPSPWQREITHPRGSAFSNIPPSLSTGRYLQKKRKELIWMLMETSSGEILMITASWFLYKRKPVRVEIHQKSVTEMPIL